jgi:hypothetical protein
MVILIPPNSEYGSIFASAEPSAGWEQHKTLWRRRHHEGRRMVFEAEWEPVYFFQTETESADQFLERISDRSHGIIGIVRVWRDKRVQTVEVNITTESILSDNEHNRQAIACMLQHGLDCGLQDGELKVE